MRNFKLIASAAVTAGAALGIGAAAAADLPARMYSKAPAMASPVSDWIGFYLGINGGGAWGRTDTSLGAVNDPVSGFYDLDNIPGVNAAGTNRINTSGAVAGGQIGYVWQSGKAIVGIEAAFDWTNLKGARTGSQAYFDNPAIFTINQNPSADWLFTFLGRAGYDMGSWYPYLTAGVAVADLKYGFNYTDLTFAPGCACAAAFSQTKAGFAGGAGVAWKLNHNWSLRGEYLYIAFDSLSGTSGIVGSGGLDSGTASFSHSAKFTENVARVALDYRFGGPVAANY
jgi:outer membrane immunogenic protein